MKRQTAVPHFAKPRRPRRRFSALARTALTALSLVALGLSAARAQVATSYTVTDLGVVSGAAHSYPYALNDAATTATGTPLIRVVGHTVTSKGVGYHAFYWDSATKVITDIGAFSGGQSGAGRDVNSKGEVVGSADTVSGGNGRAFYWNPSLGAGKLVALSQTLNNLNSIHNGTAVASDARSINDAGTIVGMVYREDWGTVSVYWQKDASGTYQCYELPGYETPDQFSAALSNSTGAININASGDIAGSLPDSDIQYNSRAVVWKNEGTAASPSYRVAFDSGVTDSGCRINNMGQSAGGYSTPTGNVSFFWVPGVAGLQDIGSLGYGRTGVRGLNDNGQIVGESAVLSDGTQHAYLWTPGAIDGIAGNPQMKDLGTLGGTRSWGRGINKAGVVVGRSKLAGSNTLDRAFRWDSAGGIKDLNDATLTPSKGTFSEFREARKISDRGYIVGDGVIKKGGYTHAFLLTPK